MPYLDEDEDGRAVQAIAARTPPPNACHVELETYRLLRLINWSDWKTAMMALAVDERAIETFSPDLAVAIAFAIPAVVRQYEFTVALSLLALIRRHHAHAGKPNPFTVDSPDCYPLRVAAILAAEERTDERLAMLRAYGGYLPQHAARAYFMVRRCGPPVVPPPNVFKPDSLDSWEYLYPLLLCRLREGNPFVAPEDDPAVAHVRAAYHRRFGRDMFMALESQVKAFDVVLYSKLDNTAKSTK